MKAKVFALPVLLTMAIVFFSVTGLITHDLLEKRKQYWESILDSEIPDGMPKRQVQQWAQNRQLFLDWIPGKNMFFANAGAVKEVGIGFPCSSWTLSLHVYIGDDGTVEKKEVQATGNCF